MPVPLPQGLSNYLIFWEAIVLPIKIEVTASALPRKPSWRLNAFFRAVRNQTNMSALGAKPMPPHIYSYPTFPL